jgi:hypothetical protein
MNLLQSQALTARWTSCRALLLLVTCHSTLITVLRAEPLAKGIQDNSFLVEEAYNQEPGVVQHIFNFPLLFSGSDKEFTPTFTQEWPVFSQTHQFSYTLPYTFTETDSGFEDMRLNYRLQLLTEDERVPAFAPRFSLVLPIGDAEKGFGHERLGYEINLPFSKVVANRWSVHFNAGGTIFPDVRGHDLINYNLGGSAIFAVSRDFNLMLESIAAWEEDVDLTGRASRSITALVSPGARYAFNLPNDLQIVAGAAVPIGLTSDSPDWGLFFYLSFEHPFLQTQSTKNE